MPICCPGLAEGAVGISGTPLSARTSLAGRMLKLRTIGPASALPARSAMIDGSSWKRYSPACSTLLTTTLRAWPKLRVSRRSDSLTSAAPPVPRRTSETPLVDRRETSIASSNTMSIERTKKRREPSTRLIAAMAGGKVSGTTFSVTSSDSPALPPVSVARTCTVMVLPPLAMVGTWAKSSKGKAGSSDTTCPLTISSTLRTWTSSVTPGRTVSVPPSITCTPGVTGSASTALMAIETTGGVPWVSKPM